MRSLPDLGDVFLSILVGLLIVADVVLYSGVIVRDRAIDFRVSPAPSLSPAATPTPAQGTGLRPDEVAERDHSAGLPGRFVPTQGRQHVGAYQLNAHVPFCDPGVVRAGCYASNPPTSGLHLPVQPLVVMSPDPDLAPDSIALAAWTRVDDFPASDYDDARARSFIKAHSCRFDPERFCPPRPLT